MEMDFFGIKPTPEVKDSAGAGRRDGAFSEGSAIRWPYESKASPTQPFMPFRASQDGEPAKFVVHQLPSSVYRPAANVSVFEANQRTLPALSTQKPFNLNKPAIQLHAEHVYQSRSTSSFAASSHLMNAVRMHPMVSYHSIPGAITGSYSNVAPSALKQRPFREAAGIFAPRSTPVPCHATEQMTIFYAGSVNAFDNVSMEKAEQIMLSVAKMSLANRPAVCPTQSESLVKPMTKVVSSDVISAKQTAIQKQAHVTLASSTHPISVSVSLQTGPVSMSTSSANNVPAMLKTLASCSPKEQPEPLKTPVTVAIVPGAIPQARKASLARFLERRKERVTSVTPYSRNAKSSDSGSTPTLSSSNNETPFSIWGDSWSSGEPKNASYSETFLSTQLKI